MASAIASTAISRKPAATSSGLRPSLISLLSWVNFSLTISASRGRFASLPKIFGKNSGLNLPSITLQSVTVRGPPRLYAAGPGLAPADLGPTLYRIPSKKQIEPPPAATV